MAPKSDALGGGSKRETGWILISSLWARATGGGIMKGSTNGMSLGFCANTLRPSCENRVQVRFV